MNDFSIMREMSRKLFHLLILIFPTCLVIFGKWKTLAFVAPIALVVIGTDYFRKKSPRLKLYFEKVFGKILRQHELTAEKLCGASWMLLAMCLIFTICSEEIAVTAFAILAISDSFAAIIGKSFISKPFFEKSTAGSLAFYLSGLIVLFVCGGMFHSRLWFYLFGFFALFCATIIEARPSFFDVDDNFSIPVSFASIMTVFDLMWNYNY